MFSSFQPRLVCAPPCTRLTYSFPYNTAFPCHFSIPEPLVVIFAHPLAWNSGSSSMRSSSTFVILFLSRSRNTSYKPTNKFSNSMLSLRPFPPLKGFHFSLSPHRVSSDVSPPLGSPPLHPTPQCSPPDLYSKGCDHSFGAHGLYCLCHQFCFLYTC